MKELRLLIATICLIYLALLAPSLSASSLEIDDSDSRGEIHTSSGRILHSESEKKKEIAKKNIERLKKIAEAKKKAKKKTKKTTTVTPKTPIVPVKPVTTPKKPVTPPPVVAPVTKSSTVKYTTPEGIVPVTFTVTVKSGIIIAASSVTKAQDESSIWYQNAFAAKLSGSVVGKKVSGLSLSAIGGASLTTAAFNQFVTSSF